jgi:broad specificity phosphatase PhoE
VGNRDRPETQGESMLSDEIREGLAKVNEKFARNEQTADVAIANTLLNTMQFVAEIAAQLTELNEGLQNRFQPVLLRDQFALAALAGVLSDNPFVESPKELANRVYSYADAMISAREEK